jgi:methylated-DNA-[protein]-cysteine S-methyltransferase
MAMNYTYLDSPVARMLIAGDADALRLIHFHNGKPSLRPGKDWEENFWPFREVVRQLRAYFAGKLREFDLPLAPEGTEFQRKVWSALERIPYGETLSYGELARRIGNPKASRAVGLANGANPIPIIIPCHRVIGSDGTLTGYGGGLAIKEKLLALEQKQLRLL